MNDSFELDIMIMQEPENQWLKLEVQIVSYLRSLGLEMKTDPLRKQETFHQRRRQQFVKASTTQFEQTSIKQLDCSANSIRSRRSPSHTPSSSPLVFASETLQTRKSLFSNKMEDFAEDEEIVKDYFANM